MRVLGYGGGNGVAWGYGQSSTGFQSATGSFGRQAFRLDTLEFTGITTNLWSQTRLTNKEGFEVIPKTRKASRSNVMVSRSQSGKPAQG